jgi:hypothetical protein
VRTLYFDIDGTLLVGSFGAPKATLARGAFERAVRAAGFQRLVCVGNVIGIVRQLERDGRAIDGLGMVLRVCQGVFEDEAWFRAVTTLVDDPARRALAIELGGDWFWVDDLAPRYCEEAGVPALRAHLGGRILAPVPEGDGADILAWLRTCGER